MRCKLFSPLLLTVLVLTVPSRAQEGQPQTPPQDEEVLTRGAFLTTRPKTANREGATVAGGAGVAVTTPETASAPPAVAARTPPAKAKKSVAKSHGKAVGKKTNGKSAPAVKDEAASTATTPGTAANSNVEAAAAETKPRPIGLGYTFFTLGDNGLAIRTDPARRFRTGEAIRIALESNTDGYLYIFHTENDGAPSMIFPDMRLGGGNNLVRAHVPYEIPSSQEATEETRWFVFKDPPAAERLYIVLARQPLAGVPTGEALAAHCFESQQACPWRPAASVWKEIKAAEEREQVAVSKVKDQGRAQTMDERVAATRGLGLGAGAPTPSVIRMTASANSKMLITAIDLIHK